MSSGKASNKNEIAKRNYQHFKGSSLEYIMYPRCEYFTRFNGISLVEMLDPLHWGSYFRSFNLFGNSDRVNGLLKQTKTIRRGKEKIDKLSPFALSGIIKSPFRFSAYQALCGNVDDESPKERLDLDDTNSDLYDQLIEYKCRMCEIAIEEFNAEFANVVDSNIHVYYQNRYPCLLVHVKASGRGQVPSQSLEARYLNEIWVAFAIAIINYHAYVESIPTETVRRASFGQNLPGIAVTDATFRISMGLVPEIFVRKVLVKSFLKLNEIIPQILNAKIGLSSIELEKINADISIYNEKHRAKDAEQHVVEFWTADDTFFDVLHKVGDASGCKVCVQLNKERRYIDLLINYVLNELFCSGESAHIVTPLRKFLKHLNYGGNEVTLTVKDIKSHQHIYAIPKRDFVENASVNETIQNDSNFWDCIEKISMAFEKRSISTLCNAVASKRMHGIYRSIEEANLELIMNSGDQKCEDGYGSDSDCEIDITIDGTAKRKVYRSKKVITATGMRALYAAAFLIKYHSGVENFRYEHSYFEIPDAIQSVLDAHLNFDVKQKTDQKILMIDMNYCNASGNPDAGHVDLEEIKRNELATLNGKKSAAIVFDCTSSTTDQIRAAIELFIPYTEIVIVVTSGLKNEQIGADVNPYGVIRIICNDGELIDHLCDMVKSILTQIDRMDGFDDNIELPMHAHNIRKCYKQIGATVTSQAIFKRSNWIYKKIEKAKKKRNMEEWPMEFKQKYPEAFECLMDDIASNEKAKKAMNEAVLDWNVWKTELIDTGNELLNISFVLQNEPNPLKATFNITERCFKYQKDFSKFISHEPEEMVSNGN